MGTIQFPKNVKFLNEKLPKPKYECEEPNTVKTLKIIKNCERKESVKKLLPIPSLQTIKSEKQLPSENQKKDITLARKPKALNKNGSQKLIF